MSGSERGMWASEVGRSRRRPVAGPGGGWQSAVLRRSVAVAVGAGLLMACGNDGGDDASTVGDFCAQLERMNLTLDSRGWFETDDDGSGGEVVLDAVRSVDAPAEIGDQWETLVEVTENSIEAERDGSDFELDEESEGGAMAMAAAERVEAYADVQCSVYLGSS